MKFEGTATLEQALKRARAIKLEETQMKNLTEMFNRSRPSNPLMGGTPFDTGELRLSVSINFGEFELGYIKEYAPHVEYGHATKNGGFVQGQKFLKTNVEIQKPIYLEDLKKELARIV